MSTDRLYPVFIHDDDLARLDITLVFCADGIERACLGSKYIGLPDPAHAERLKAIRISGGDEFFRAHD